MLTSLAAQNWAMFVLRGVLAIALGVLAFTAPGPTLGALIFVFAAYALIDGFLAVVLGFAAPQGPRWLLVIGGFVAIAIGAYTVISPQVTAVALVLLIGAFVLVRGIAEIGTAVWFRNYIESAWLYVLNGIVSVVFGTYLIVAPGEGALAVVFVIGFYALFAGVTYIAMGLQLRQVNKTLHEAAASAS